MIKNIIIIAVFFGVTFMLGVMLKSNKQISFPIQKGGNMRLTSVFTQGDNIPSDYTCDGEDISPELIISDVPKNAKSLALIVDDPDAPMGLFVHWVLYNIPPSTTNLSSLNIPKGAIEGMTSFGRVGYGGPCPPDGKHRYFFKLYALDKMLDLPAGVTKVQLKKAMDAHIIEKTELMGVYNRK